MSRIHQTANIEPGAEIASDVSIGAYAHVGASVRLGSGCSVHHHGVVEGNSILGENNEIFPFAYVGGKTQDLKYDGSRAPLIIGNGNVFREYSTVHCPSQEGSETRIGNGNHLLAYAHVAHECILQDGIVISSKAVLGGHVEVDSHAIIGGASAVHQYCKIGKYALLGGLSALVHDLPPFMIAEGNRARVRAYNRIGLQRHGFTEEQILAVHRMFRCLYSGTLNRSQGLEQIRGDGTIPTELKEELLNFHRRCKRGMA
jgi:UDP-N-acetylglucosamine acyltransferase